MGLMKANNIEKIPLDIYYRKPAIFSRNGAFLFFIPEASRSQYSATNFFGISSQNRLELTNSTDTMSVICFIKRNPLEPHFQVNPVAANKLLKALSTLLRYLNGTVDNFNKIKQEIERLPFADITDQATPTFKIEIPFDEVDLLLFLESHVGVTDSKKLNDQADFKHLVCLLYTSPSPRD